MNLIAGHPEIAPIYETGFLRNLLSICERAEKTSHEVGLRKMLRLVANDPLQKKIRQFVCKVLPYYQATDRRKFGKTKDEFFPFGNQCIEYTFCELVRETERFAAALPASDDSFRAGRSYIDRLFGLHCSRMNRPYWVSKTPSLVRSLGPLHKMYPEAALIHIVRDGRDVTLSTIGLKQGPNTVRAAARRWHDMVRSGQRLRGNGRYLEVRYEDLIGTPDITLRKVFDALGVDRGVVRELPGLRIYSHREKVWRTGLTEADRRAFAEEGGDLLIELGYEKDDAWIA